MIKRPGEWEIGDRVVAGKFEWTIYRLDYSPGAEVFTVRATGKGTPTGDWKGLAALLEWDEFLAGWTYPGKPL